MKEQVSARVSLDAIERLTRDIRDSAKVLSRGEARYLVDAYYTMQEQRMRSAAQVRALSTAGEPCGVLTWYLAQSEALEREVGKALDAYSASHPVGKWARSVVGVGPVIAAGLLAHIDITRAPTAGHVWSFAGLNPTATWQKGERRPWNAALKTLCWKIGESFVKQQDRDGAYYGRVYAARKAEEWRRNIAGEFAEQATRSLATRQFGTDTLARAWYEGWLTADDAREIVAERRAQEWVERRIKMRKGEGTQAPGRLGGGVVGVPMLPPARIHLRASRYAVKLFLAHLWEVWRRAEGLEVVAPYPIAVLGHAHHIPPEVGVRRPATTTAVSVALFVGDQEDMGDVDDVD